MPQVSRLVRTCWRAARFGVPPRHRNDYATHIPILVGIGSSLRIEKILEFGAGFYSTLTFLNRLAFPKVISVDSVESDHAWLSKVRAGAHDDCRLQMRLVSEPIEAVLDELNLSDYDLILVDSSTESARRASLIRELALRRIGAALVAVHDFEIDAYQKAANGFRKSIQISAYNPCTGVMWQAEKGPEKILKNLTKVIGRHKRRLEPDDLESWSVVFREKNKVSSAVD